MYTYICMYVICIYIQIYLYMKKVNVYIYLYVCAHTHSHNTRTHTHKHRPRHTPVANPALANGAAPHHYLALAHRTRKTPRLTFRRRSTENSDSTQYV